MEKGLQIWCRISMNFCECIANILDIWSWQRTFANWHLWYTRVWNFGKNIKILFSLFHFEPFFEKCGIPRLEYVTDDLSTRKSKTTVLNSKNIELVPHDATTL